MTGTWTDIWHRARPRAVLAVAAAAATAIPFAEGTLKSGWLEGLFLIPIVWFLVTQTPPEWLKNLLLSLSVLCVTVPLLDLVLRPVMDRRLNYTPLNVYARRLPQLPIVGRWDSHLHLVDTLYGDLSAVAGEPAYREYRSITFDTDEAGFRNGTIPKEVDMLVLGDSFAAGWGTTQDKIFAGLLESRYGRRVYNLAYPGGPYDQFVNFSIETPRIRIAPHAKVVWTIFTGNDLDDAGGEVWEVEHLPWRGKVGQWQVQFRTFRNRSPLNRWMYAIRSRVIEKKSDVIVRELPDKRPILFLGVQEAWGRRSRTEVEQQPNFPKLERTFAAMRQRVDQDGLDVTVLILPTKGQVYPWLLAPKAVTDDEPVSGFAEAVKGACERAQFRCFDMLPYLTQRARQLYTDSGELLWWRDDTHLGERGHEAVAEFIADQVLGLNGSSAVGLRNSDKTVQAEESSFGRTDRTAVLAKTHDVLQADAPEEVSSSPGRRNSAPNR